MPRVYNHTGVTVVCPVCSEESYRYPSQVKKGYKNYCSKRCWYSIMKPNEKMLEGLNKARTMRNLQDPEYRALRSRIAKEAFKSGKVKKRFGADNNLWRGGIATLQNKLRQTAVYKEWRKQVYERDNYLCQHCGTRKDLHAHHIKTFSKYPELRYEVDNGITLCRPCHGDVHGRVLPDISKANKGGSNGKYCY